MPPLSGRCQRLCPMSQTRQFIPLKEAQAPFFVGIDLGGTNIKVGVVDDLGRPLSWLTIPTEIETGRRRRRAAHGRGGAARRSPRRGLKPAGRRPRGARLARHDGHPRRHAGQAGRTCRGWDNFPIRDRVSHHCGLPVTFANDANAAAYGEFWVGSGRDFHSLVLLTLGTGIGCGIIIGDLIVDGEHSHGGECGHIIIDCARRRPPVRLRPARAPRGLRQRHGRDQADRGGCWPPAARRSLAARHRSRRRTDAAS